MSDLYLFCTATFENDVRSNLMAIRGGLEPPTYCLEGIFRPFERLISHPVVSTTYI